MEEGIAAKAELPGWQQRWDGKKCLPLLRASCSICHEIYDDDGFVPMVLPCGTAENPHHVCETCKNKMSRNSKVECPFCRTVSEEVSIRRHPHFSCVISRMKRQELLLQCSDEDSFDCSSCKTVLSRIAAFRFVCITCYPDVPPILLMGDPDERSEVLKQSFLCCRCAEVHRLLKHSTEANVCSALKFTGYNMEQVKRQSSDYFKDIFELETYPPRSLCTAMKLWFDLAEKRNEGLTVELMDIMTQCLESISIAEVLQRLGQDGNFSSEICVLLVRVVIELWHTGQPLADAVQNEQAYDALACLIWNLAGVNLLSQVFKIVKAVFKEENLHMFWHLNVGFDIFVNMVVLDVLVKIAPIGEIFDTRRQEVHKGIMEISIPFADVMDEDLADTFARPEIAAADTKCRNLRFTGHAGPAAALKEYADQMRELHRVYLNKRIDGRRKHRADASPFASSTQSLTDNAATAQQKKRHVKPIFAHDSDEHITAPPIRSRSGSGPATRYAVTSNRREGDFTPGLDRHAPPALMSLRLNDPWSVQRTSRSGASGPGTDAIQLSSTTPAAKTMIDPWSFRRTGDTVATSANMSDQHSGKGSNQARSSIVETGASVGTDTRPLRSVVRRPSSITLSNSGAAAASQSVQQPYQQPRGPHAPAIVSTEVMPPISTASAQCTRMLREMASISTEQRATFGSRSIPVENDITASGITEGAENEKSVPRTVTRRRAAILLGNEEIEEQAVAQSDVRPSDGRDESAASALASTSPLSSATVEIAREAQNNAAPTSLSTDSPVLDNHTQRVAVMERARPVTAARFHRPSFNAPPSTVSAASPLRRSSSVRRPNFAPTNASMRGRQPNFTPGRATRSASSIGFTTHRPCFTHPPPPPNISEASATLPPAESRPAPSHSMQATVRAPRILNAFTQQEPKSDHVNAHISMPISGNIYTGGSGWDF